MIPRIVILDEWGNPVSAMDNNATKSLCFYDDTIHEYLEGNASTFNFKVSAKHSEAQYLTLGSKLSFQTDDKTYYFNIVTREEDESEIRITGYSTTFELLNETLPGYTAAAAMTFKEYLNEFGLIDNRIKIGHNEISSNTKKITWEGSGDTILKRLFSLASNFGAEIEFIPVLNANNALDYIKINLYKQHDATHQGLGQARTDISLVYGINVSGITKTADMSDMCTQLYPTGKDGLTLNKYSKYVYDNGLTYDAQQTGLDAKLLYYTPLNSVYIYAPEARNNFPSENKISSDNWISGRWETEYSTQATLWGNALAKIKELSTPKSSYKVSGYYDLNIGDTVQIRDEEFNQPIYLEARVSEKQWSLSDPSEMDITFDNFTEVSPKIDANLLAIQRAMRKIPVTLELATSNGTTFKSREDFTKFTATVRSNDDNVTDEYFFKWYIKNDVVEETEEEVYRLIEGVEGRFYTLYAEGFQERTIIKCEAYLQENPDDLKAVAEITVTGLAPIVESTDQKINELNASTQEALDSVDAKLSEASISLDNLATIVDENSASINARLDDKLAEISAKVEETKEEANKKYVINSSYDANYYADEIILQVHKTIEVEGEPKEVAKGAMQLNGDGVKIVAAPAEGYSGDTSSLEANSKGVKISVNSIEGIAEFNNEGTTTPAITLGSRDDTSSGSIQIGVDIDPRNPDCFVFSRRNNGNLILSAK